MIGQVIKELRCERGWTQNVLASKLHISNPALSKIETGITDISLTRLWQIAQVFQIEMTELFVFCDPDEQLQSKIQTRDHELKIALSKISSYENRILELQATIIELHEALVKK